MPIDQQFFHTSVAKVNPVCWDMMTKNGHEFFETKLSFYVGYTQLSVNVYPQAPIASQAFHFLVGQTQLRNANSYAIYAVNKEEHLHLSSSSARDYMRFFLRFGEESSPRFTFIDRADEIRWGVEATAEQQVQTRALVQPLSVKGHSGYFMIQVYAIRQRVLFRMTYGLEANGTVTKMNEVQLLTGLSLAYGVYT
jgi:hypothetical protein